jgi:hypothetical protein
VTKITCLAFEEKNMNNDLGSVYLAEAIAKHAINEALYGKPKAKKPSFIKRMMKRIKK